MAGLLLFVVGFCQRRSVFGLDVLLACKAKAPSKHLYPDIPICMAHGDRETASILLFNADTAN